MRVFRVRCMQRMSPTNHPPTSTRSPVIPVLVKYSKFSVESPGSGAHQQLVLHKEYYCAIGCWMKFHCRREPY